MQVLRIGRQWKLDKDSFVCRPEVLKRCLILVHTVLWNTLETWLVTFDYVLTKKWSRCDSSLSAQSTDTFPSALVFDLSVNDKFPCEGCDFVREESKLLYRKRTSPQPTGTPPCFEEVTFSFLFLQTEAIQAYPAGSAGCYVLPPLPAPHCFCCHNLRYKTSAVAQQSSNSPLQSGSKAPFIRRELARTNHILPYQPDEYYSL